MSLIGGCDPGTTHLGMAWLDPERGMARMVNINLKSWDNKVHVLNDIDYGACVHEYCITAKSFFDKCTHFGIERLPPKIRQGKKTKGTNRQVHSVMCYVEQTIRDLYPHIRVYYVAPVSLKAMMNSGGGKTHAESKALSAVSNTLPPHYMDMAVQTFWDKKLQVDPIEALQVAMYVNLHKDKLEASDRPKELPPRQFKEVVYTAPVIFPTENAKKKKCKLVPVTQTSRKRIAVNTETVRKTPKKTSGAFTI